MERFSKTDLTQKITQVMRASFVEPIIITDRRQDSHVLMTIEHYTELMQRLDKAEEEKE